MPDRLVWVDLRRRLTVIGDAAYVARSTKWTFEARRSSAACEAQRFGRSSTCEVPSMEYQAFWTAFVSDDLVIAAVKKRTSADDAYRAISRRSEFSARANIPPRGKIPAIQMCTQRGTHMFGLVSRTVLALGFVLASLAGSTAVFAQTRTAEQGKVKVEWLGHEFYRLTSPKGVVVITSPWLANPDGPVPLNDLARRSEE